MRMSVQRHALVALTLGKRSGTHCTGGWVGPRAGMGGYEKSPLPEFDPWIVQSAASPYTARAISSRTEKLCNHCVTAVAGTCIATHSPDDGHGSSFWNAVRLSVYHKPISATCSKSPLDAGSPFATGKRRAVPIEQEAGRAPEPVFQSFYRTKKFVSPAGIRNPRIPAQAPVTMTTALSLLSRYWQCLNIAADRKLLSLQCIKTRY